jgi:exopolysaccharide production protein ExoZ
MSSLATRAFRLNVETQIAPARNLHLQCLRGIAALMVMLYHASAYLTLLYGDGAFSSLFDGRFGLYGVCFFFALSGCLMADLLNRQDAFSFMAARILRIYPTFLLTVLAVTVLYTAFGMPFRPREAGLLLMPYVPNGWLPLHVEWTLLYEMMFYVMLFIISVAGFRRFVPTLAMIWIVLVTAIAVISGADPWNYTRPLHEMVLLMPNLAFAGGLLIPQLQLKAIPVWAALVLCLLSLAACGHLALLSQQYFASVSAVLLVGSLVGSEKSPARGVGRLLSAVGAKLGDWSYALYLCHAAVCIFVYKYWPHLPRAFAFLTAVSLSLLAGAIMGEIDVLIHRRAKEVLKSSPRAAVAAFVTLYVVTFVGYSTITSYKVVAAENSVTKATQVLNGFKDDADNDGTIIGHVDLLKLDGDVLTASGWALNQSGDRRAVFLGVVMDAEVLDVARMTEPRVDVVNAYHLPLFRTAPPGFVASAKMQCGADLKLIAFTLDGRHRQLEKPSKIGGC